MDPITATVAISAATSLLSGVAGFQQAQYQSAVAAANAKTAKLNAEHAVDIGMSNVEDIGTENAGRIGRAAARMGASGIAVSSPSFDQARARGRQLNIQENRRTIEGAYREAANFRSQSAQFSAEADAGGTASLFELAGGFLGAAGAVSRGKANNIAFGGDSGGSGGPLDLLQRKKRGSPFYNYGSGFNTGF